MRQDNENRRALVYPTTYENYVEKFTEDIDTHKKLHDFKTYGPDFSTLGNPVIFIPGLFLGGNLNSIDTLEKWRVSNKLDKLSIYISSWSEEYNLEALTSFLHHSKKYPNLKVYTTLQSYTGIEFREFIDQVYSSFGVSASADNIPPHVLKRFCTPFIYKKGIDLIALKETNNPFVIKFRTASNLHNVGNYSQSLEAFREKICFSSSTKQILDSSFFSNFIVSDFTSNDTVCDILFGAPLSTLELLFNNNFNTNLCSILKDDFVNLTYSDITLDEFEKLMSTFNYASSYDGSVWLGKLCKLFSIPFYTDFTNILSIVESLYRVRLPYFYVENNELRRFEPYTYKIDNPDKSLNFIGKTSLI